jgi:hypothetical protein
LGKIVDPAQNFGQKRFSLIVSELPGGGNQLGTATLQADLNQESTQSGQKQAFTLEQPAPLIQGQEYFLELHLAPGQGPVKLTGSLDLRIQSEQGPTQSFALEDRLVDYGTPFTTSFIAPVDGFLTGAELTLSGVQTQDQDEALLLNITSDPEGQNWLTSASLSGDLTGEAKPTGTVLKLDQPVELEGRII